MKKRVFRSAISILLVICMSVSLIPAGMLVLADESGAGQQTDGYVSDDNGYIKYFVDTATGGFYILPSADAFDGTKAASFGTVILDGVQYVFGGDYADSEFTLPPYIGDSGTCQTEWRIGDVYITQFLNIVQNDAETDSYAVYIRYEASAASVLDASATGAANIGVTFAGRILLDTMFGPEDDMPVTVSDSAFFITNETSFSGDDVPEHYGLDATFTDVTPRAYGLMSHETVTRPTAVTFAHFDNVSGTVFDYAPVTEVRFTDAGSDIGADSAALLYFEGQRDSAEEPLYFATIYGFDELTYSPATPVTGGTSGGGVNALLSDIQTGTPTFAVGVGDVSSPTLVNFGGREWSVIGYDGAGVFSEEGTLTLLANERLGGSLSFYGSSNARYSTSELKTRMDSGYNDLPSGEKSMVVERALDGIFGAAVNDAKFWPLSYDEANSVNLNVRKLGDDSSGSVVWHNWWTRTYDTSTSYSVYLISGSTGACTGSVWTNYANSARPACILDLSSVLFSSSATGKDVAVGASLTAAAAPTGTIKFTVESDGLAADITDFAFDWGAKTAAFSYADATAGATLSAAIKDENGALTYYGKLEENISATGTATLNLPSDFSFTDTLMIFVETCNAGEYTDFCSDPYEVPLRPMISSTMGEGFILSVVPDYDGTSEKSLVIKQDDETFVGGEPTRAIKAISLKGSEGNDIAFSLIKTADGTQLDFMWPYDDLTLEVTSVQARKITIPEKTNVSYVFTDMSVETTTGMAFTPSAAAVGNEITLFLTAGEGTIPDETISIVDTNKSQAIMDVTSDPYIAGPANSRIYAYTFTMPDADVTFVFDVAQVELSHYSVVTNAPSGRGELVLLKDGQEVTDGLVEPGSTVTVEIRNKDTVHSDFHGLTAENYISGVAVAVQTVTAEETYTFTMPKHSVAVNLDMRQKPSFAVKVDSNADAVTEISNDRSGAVSRESLTGYIGDQFSFFVTNNNIKKTIKSVQVWETDAEGETVNCYATIPAADPYADRFSGQFTMHGKNVLIKVVLEDAPAIPVTVESGLPSGNVITPDSGTVLLGDAVTFAFTTKDTRYLLYRPIMRVYDESDNLLYEHLFENASTHTADNPLAYASSEINKTSGVPAKIVLDVQDRAVTYTKELHSIVPNSSQAELFKTIDVIGLNMYEGDIGEVYFGTSPNPTQSATPYITAYGEKSLTIEVPQAMLPVDNDVTYYVKINGVEKSCTVTVNRLLRTTPYGWLAIVSDSSNNHSVIIADSESELMTLKGYSTIVMKLNGGVKYNKDADYYEFSESPVLINNTATFTAAAGKPLRVKQTGTSVVLSAEGGRMSVPGYTFVRGEDITATLTNGIKYSDVWAKNSEGNWANANVRNIVFEYDTFGLDATLPVLKDGLTVEIRNAILLKDTVMFGGRLRVQLTVVDVSKDKDKNKTNVKLESNSFEVDIKRLAFGNNNGNFAFKGVEGVGEINLDSLEIPSLDFSSPSGTLAVNTFTNQYSIEASMDFKLVKMEGKLTLEPLNNGWPMIDSFKAVFGSQPGIPILPVAPVGYITSGGAGFSGVVRTLNGNFNAIPPIMVSIYGSFDLIKLLKMNDIVFNVGPSEISFSAKPKIAGIDLFDKFGGGLYITQNGVRFTVAVEAVLLKSFDIIRGGGNVEVSYLNRRFSFSGNLFARVQIPQIPTGLKYWHIYKWYKPWKGEWRDITIGPITLLETRVGINDAGASASVSVLGFDVKAEYRWGTGRPSISLFSAGLDNTMEVTQDIYDDSGEYVGYVSFGGNLSPVAVCEPARMGVSAFSARALKDIKITLGEIVITAENYLEYEAEPSQIGETYPDYRHHTLVFPAGIENDVDDYALVITAPKGDIRITAPNGAPFILKYAEGDLDAAGLNAVAFGDDSIMIRLPKEEGTWKIDSTEGFGSGVIAVAPLPKISEAAVQNTNEIAWAVKNLDALDTSKDYVLEVRMAKDDWSDVANADPGILIDEITVSPDPDGSASGVYVIDPDLLSDFESGDYYPVLSLLSVQNGLYDDNKQLLEDGDFKTPLSSKNSGTPYTHVHPLQPGAVATAVISAGGGGALRAEWSAVANADGYVVSVFDKDGNPVYMEAEPGSGSAADKVQVVYDIPGGEESTMEASLGSLTPGMEYYIEVAAYRTISKEHDLGGGEMYTHNTRLFGGAAKSNIYELPVPKFPVIYADLPGGESFFDDAGNRIVYVNSSFGFTVSADQQVMFTVQQDGTVIYSSAAAETEASVNAVMGDLSASGVTVTAVNAGGDMSHLGFTVYLDDVPPPLFINTDDESSIYTDMLGDYVVTGRSEPYATISDDLGNKVQANKDGEFALTGNLPSGSDDTLRTIRATDNAGNITTADILIKSFAAVAATLESIIISPTATVSIATGENFPISATGVLTDGSKITIAPNAVSYNVHSGGTSVLVDTDTGRVTARAQGRAVMAVSLVNGSDTLTSDSLVVLINDADDDIATYPVTIVSQGTGATANGSHAEGAVVSISAGTPPANMRFAGWSSSPAVVFADANSANTSFTMIGEAVTITAVFQALSGSGPVGGETGGEAQGRVNGKTVDLTQNKDGSVSLDLAAEDVAKYPASGDVYTIEVEGASDVNVSFPISAVLDTDATHVKVTTAGGSVTLTRDMLEAYKQAHGDTLEMSIKGGGFTVDLLKNGASTGYSDPENPLIISLPVSAAAGTDTSGYVAERKDASGTAILPYSVYRDGEVVFLTSSTGTFSVKNNGKKFTDVTKHWALDNVTFVTARNIFSGIGGDLFSPDTPMTRAMFVQVIANIEGADLSTYKTSQFTDVAAGAWYSPAVQWAAEKKIVGGYGGGLFGPEDNISREQMAVMLVNYIEYKGYTLPKKQVEAFGDESSIASWAGDAVKYVQAAGIVSGKPGNLYDPKGVASRAEVATIFANFVNAYLEQHLPQ